MNFEMTDTAPDDSTSRMAALVDIVFILLAFFILAARFAGNERDVPLGYRESDTAAGATAADFPSAIPVRLLRSETGEARAVIGQAALREGDFDGITAKLNEIDMPELPVILAADPTLSVDQVAHAIDAVLKSPMKQLSLTRLETRLE